MDSKVCNKCALDQPLENFHKSSRGKFGRVTYCKTCRTEINKEDQKSLTAEQKEIRAKKLKIYYYKDLDKNRKRQRQYNQQKRAIDPLFKLSGNLRNLVKNGFLAAQSKGFNFKNKKTENILGCSFEELKVYFESKFDQNMNWENYGIYWTIDHIYPVSLAKSEEELYSLNHYSNLQPLEKIQNIKKRNNITHLV